jgi:hypothetical protein
VVMNSIFWNITSCSPLKVSCRFERTCRLHLQGGKISPAELCSPSAFTLLSCSVYSSDLKMETIYFSETSVDFQRTTWLYIQERTHFNLFIIHLVKEKVKLSHIF